MIMKKILLYILAFSTSFVYAQKTAQGTGLWHQITWSPPGTPGTTDDVVIPDNITVIITDEAVTVRSISITGDTDGQNNPGVLQTDQNLTITGASSTNSSVSGTLTVNSTVVISASDLTVASTGKIDIVKGKQLVLENSSTTLTVSAGGEFFLNSDSNEFSSLVNNLGATINGNVKYQRSISGVDSSWDLIGSPVTGQSASGIVNQTALANNDQSSPEEFGIGEYDNSSENDDTDGYGSWSTFSLTEATLHGTLPSGKGYQMATDGSANSNIDFTGGVNTSSVNRPISEGDASGDTPSVPGTRFNLVANPYPSYISVNNLAAGESSNGSDYLLKQSNLDVLHTNNQGVYVFNGSDYTAIGTSTSAASAVVAPGQGFMVGGRYDDVGSPTFVFTTAMQTEDGSDDGIANDLMDDNRAELFIGLNQTDINRHTEIYFLDDGSDEFTSADVGGFGSNYNSISTRSVAGDNNTDLAIQTLAFSEMWDKIIPLSIDVLGGEEMTISISHRTTPADLNIFLEDTEDGTMTNLLEGDFVYTPSSDLEGVGRFFIHMTADTMSNGEVSTSLLNAYKEIDASYITIEGLATQSNETKVSLFNILGREVLSTILNNNMGIQTISTVGLSAGVYVIELESGSDRLTKKLLIQ